MPTRAFYTGIRGLFASWIPSPEFFRIGDVAAMKRHYRALTETYGFGVLPPAPIINSAGRRMLREGDVEGAAEVYEYFVFVYPRSVDAYLASGRGQGSDESGGCGGREHQKSSRTRAGERKGEGDVERAAVMRAVS